MGEIEVFDVRFSDPGLHLRTDFAIFKLGFEKTGPNLVHLGSNIVKLLNRVAF